MRAYQFEQFELTVDHPWALQVVKWEDTVLDQMDEPRPLEEAITGDEDHVTYYGIAEIVASGKELRGYAAVCHDPMFGCDSVILDLVVDPQFQRQGIGTHLLTEIENEVVERGFESIALVPMQETGSPSFYAANGYIEAHGYYDDNDTYMYKQLHKS